jgi:hypothetical protein
MVITRLDGGLGNQLFQYAAARRLAQARSAILKLDISALLDSNRPYALKHFNLVQAIATPADVGRFLGTSPPALRRRVIDRFLPYARRRGLRERHCHFDPAILDAGGDVYLNGFWQSERYFADIADLLRRELTLQAPSDAENAALAERIGAVTAVSVHVRRGDYVAAPAATAVHGALPLTYYRAAAARVNATIPAARFFVFSDDAEWVQPHLRLGSPTTFVSHNGPESGHEDLRLMSLCRHHIIANSSFGWWGAWLGEHAGQLVITPHRWFVDVTKDTRDLIPARWLQI